MGEIFELFAKFVMELKDSTKNEELEEMMEKNVKMNGNHPKSWLLYLRFLRWVSPIDKKSKIDQIFKRAVNFCSGDVGKIYESYRSYYLIYVDSDEEKLEAKYLSMVEKRKDFENLARRL